jgi:hypothetical protein
MPPDDFEVLLQPGGTVHLPALATVAAS